MDIIQSFYDKLASQYDKLFLDWQVTVKEQSKILDKLFKDSGYDKRHRILDCACGIGTQSIGLATLGYNVKGSDISNAELEEARQRAAENNVKISFENADFRRLSETFPQEFDIVIAMDNALPHMLSRADLEQAVCSIAKQIRAGGMFVGSIRDYNSLLDSKPPYSAPYIHRTEEGQRVSFQTWNWDGDRYKLVQYIIEDHKNLKISKFECEYRAVRREELTDILLSNGFDVVEWKFPEDTNFYQPIIIAKKK